MNYCKILSAKGAEQLIEKALSRSEANLKPDSRYQTHVIEWSLGRLGGKQSAQFFYKDNAQETLAAAQGIYIISPGGEVPASAMSGLASSIADRGYAVFVVLHPQNLAIIDIVSGRGNAAINLASRLKDDITSIKGLDLSILQSQQKEIYLFGHSLGGATLAAAIHDQNPNSPVDGIVLYGTAQLVSLPGKKSLSGRPLALLFGENDGLSAGDIPGFLKIFEIEYQQSNFIPDRSPRNSMTIYQQIEGLNHFCIITDSTVGNANLKKRDGSGFEHGECLNRIIETMEQLGFL